MLLVENIDETDLDTPYASKFVSTIMARIIGLDHSLPLGFLGDALMPLPNGKAAHMVATVLKLLVAQKGGDAVLEMWKEAQLDYKLFLKRTERSEEHVRKFLEQKVRIIS